MSVPILDFVGTFIGKKPAYPLIRRRSWNTDVVKYDSSFEQSNELWIYPVREWEISHKHLTEAQRAKFVELFDAGRGRGRHLYLIEPLDYQSVCTWTQPTYTIGAVSQTDDYFRISGQHAADFLVGWQFKVAGSTGNNGVYTVSDISQDASYTYIYTTEEIPSAVGDGTVLRMYFQLFKAYYPSTDYTINEPKKDIQPDLCVVEVDSVVKTEGMDYTLSDTEGVIQFVTGSTPTAGQVIEATFDFYYRVRFSVDTVGESRLMFEYYSPDTIVLVEKKRRTTEL